MRKGQKSNEAVSHLWHVVTDINWGPFFKGRITMGMEAFKNSNQIFQSWQPKQCWRQRRAVLAAANPPSVLQAECDGCKFLPLWCSVRPEALSSLSSPVCTIGMRWSGTAIFMWTAMILFEKRKGSFTLPIQIYYSSTVGGFMAVTVLLQMQCCVQGGLMW